MGYFKRRARNKTLETPATYGFEAVNRVRDRLLNTDYDRFPENQLADVIRAQKNAVWSSSFRWPEPLAEETAFDQMVIDMRLPSGPIRRDARQWWNDLVMTPDSDVYKQLIALEAEGKLPPSREFYGI